MNFPTIKGYAVTALLGRGGMGAVYLAREDETGREVALKLMRGAVSADTEFVLRFKREAEALATVAHPGIAAFVNYGEDGDYVYFAMEYVAGEPLSERLADGPLPVGDACGIAAEVAAALEAAHAAGIIHRDIKPSNIILSLSGAKITDFGLARRLEGSALTTSGRVMGSLPYMSPEQVRGEELTGASDVYSLGVVLFEMLTGRPPFESDRDETLATMVLTRPAPIVSRHRRDAPVGLDLILIKMLAKEPDLRPPGCGQVAAQLRELPEGRFRTGAGDDIGDSLFGRAASALARGALRLLPGGKAFNAAARSVASTALSSLKPDGSSALLLQAAVARRRLKRYGSEIRVLEKQRNTRLSRAECAERAGREAGVEERQGCSRLARELRLEAEVFERRIGEVGRKAAADEKRVREIEERARVLRGASR